MFDFGLKAFQYFFLVFLRVFGFVSSAPLLGANQVPYQIKVLFSLLFSFALFSSLPIPSIPYESPQGLVFLGITEAMFGLSLGFFARMVFSGVQLAGQVSGYQMGLAIANLFDPVSFSRQSVVSSLLFWLSMMIFFLLRLHYWLLAAFIDGFKTFPLAVKFVPNANIVFGINSVFAALFTVAVKVAAPIIATLLFVIISLGIVTRLIPQMNIFIVGLPVQILVGTLVLISIMPILSYLSQDVLINHTNLLFKLLQL